MATINYTAYEMMSFGSRFNYGYREEFGDGVVFQASFPTMGYGVTHTFGLLLGSTLSYQQRPGAVFTDGILFNPFVTVKAQYQPVLTDKVRFQDILGRIINEALNQGITFEGALRLSFGVKLLSTLLFKGNLGAAAKYARTLAVAIKLHDSLAQFLGGTLTSGFSLAASPTPLWRFPQKLMGEIALGDALGSAALLVKLTLSDDLDFTDQAAILQAIFAETIDETIAIDAMYLAPDGSFTTWAVNTRTGAITEYENFAFNSYGRIGNHFYGADQDGLYQLDGELDDGDAIPTRLRGGYMAHGGTRFTAFKAIYLGMRIRSNQKDFYFKLISGDGRCYIYKVRPNTSDCGDALMTTKINLGKGLRARYFRWELETVGGEDYDLESIEFIPLISKRRV